ncbi:hypothetical protein Poly30_55900 [Planctomycetes bacterium Poly30]|uniref:General stress protein 17M-like domain-containing protein n=1 Tax=Saltatorellus ferox TaxID=2528018 RepID=A0A518F133_9BACT|nr:hypothetical protein Poly30_55900 [Planctomycetes bacterium Poly30]
MTNTTTETADARPVTQDRMAESANRRTIPHDLHKKRFEHGYTVAACDNRAQAERAVVELNREGFDHNDLVLVSDEVDTLRPEPLGETFEVSNPTSLARASGLVAGGATGAAVGASLSVAIAYIATTSANGLGAAALLGGLIGVVAGAFAGRAISARMRRAPASVYDERFLKSEIMVGTGIGADHPETNRERATRALKRAGLSPTDLPGEKG